MYPAEKFKLAERLRAKPNKALIPDFKTGYMKAISRDSNEYKERCGKADEADKWENIQQRNEDNLKRINNNFSQGKCRAILGVEKAWEYYEADDDFHPLYQYLRKTVDIWVNSFMFKWANWRIDAADFEEAFWWEIWKVVDEYEPGKTDFFLLEIIEKRLYYRGNDVTRKATTTKQGHFENNTSSLEGISEQYDNEFPFPGSENVEKKVTDKILVDQILNDESLTERERKVLTMYYENNGDISFNEIAAELGLNHKEKARRLFDRATKKIKLKYQ